MRKYFLVLIFSIFALGANAQDFKPFQLYLGLGYAMPTEGGGGVLVDIEPTYRINDDIAVGLRLESAAMAKVLGPFESSVSGVASYTLNAKYYLASGGVRPYMGLGLGMFALGSSSFSGGAASVEAGTTFGFYPRLGADFGHFNINIDLNIVSKTQVEITTSESLDINNNYIGIRLGAFIFGGQN